MMVMMSAAGAERDSEITAQEADDLIASIESDPFYANRYQVVRKWDPLWFIVSVHPKGDPWSVLSFMAPLFD
jgi:hypothetical protein